MRGEADATLSLDTDEKLFKLVIVLLENMRNLLIALGVVTLFHSGTRSVSVHRALVP